MKPTVKARRTTKKATLTPLSVEPLLGEWFRAHVGSTSKPGLKYLVDLEAHNWNGWCGCKGFEVRCAPKLTRGAIPCDGLRCKHIRRFRSYALDKIMPLLAKQLKRQAGGVEEMVL